MRTLLEMERDAKGYPVHRAECDGCGGAGRVEVCPRGHQRECPCSTVEVSCEECRGSGSYLVDDCDCSLCLHVLEDLDASGRLQ